MFNEIFELEAIREQKEEMSERELVLSKPKLTDMELIPIIYDWFCEIHADTHNELDEKQFVQRRKQFVFIILYLYSPYKLVKGKMTIGLRTALAEVAGLSARSAISNDSANLLFEYQTYKSFQKSVNRAYTLIVERLEKLEFLTSDPLSAMPGPKTILY